MSDSAKDVTETLSAMNDTELYYALQQVFMERKFEYNEASDEYGWPKIQAKLSVIKHILCE